ncbi:MAG TPA: thioredoxin-like domain-containing protein [Saprospiraceae bacterium]|nr:thioredoxin-like domain-containing protein [Saprospiraceae bacterium]
MKWMMVFPLLLALSCKGNMEAAPTLKVKDPEPVMGGPTHLKMVFSDFPQSGFARIIGFYSDQNYLLDSTAVTNGKLEYVNPKGLAQGIYYIMITGRKEFVQIIMGEDQEYEMELALADPLSTMKINGSLENELFYENMRYESFTIGPRLNELNAQLKNGNSGTEAYNALKKERDALENQRLKAIFDLKAKHPTLLFANYKYGGQNPKLKEELPKELQVVQYRKEFWDNIDFNDTRLIRTPMFGIKLKRFLKELTVQHQDSILASAHQLMAKIMDKPEYYKVVANYVVLTYEPGKCPIMDAEKLFVEMVRTYFTQKRAFWSDSLQTDAIQRRATEMSLSLLGLKGPNVISTDPMGKKQELMAKTADYLIVYLFNPDCEHCMVETPKLHKYYLENKANGLDVYAIAIDTDDDKWKAYIKKNGLSWTNVHDPTNRSIYGKYYVDVTPEIYVLNKERKIIGKNLKTDQIQIIIDRDKAKK